MLVSPTTTLVHLVLQSRNGIRQLGSWIDLKKPMFICVLRTKNYSTQKRVRSIYSRHGNDATSFDGK
jgi:hypothetical protein